MKKLLLASTLSLALVSSLSAKVLASVDGQNITEEEVALLVRAVSNGIDYSTLNDEQKKDALNMQIDQIILNNAANKSGVEKTKEYKEALEKVKQNIALNVWFKNKFDSIKIDEKDIKSDYDKNKAQFVQPAQVKASHILVKTEKEAKDIIAQLKGLKDKKLAEKFEQLAKSKSIGPSAKVGGDLGYFTEKQMVPEFSKAAFALKSGNVTLSPVKSQFGYHIIYKVSEKPATNVEFEKVKKIIESKLKNEKFVKWREEELKNLRSKAKIVINK